ncbi:MAG: hypothetical protein JJU37_12200 [Balneolaceae bacterium]|nr:hypothetical protein [Balneolaceae bacterium]
MLINHSKRSISSFILLLVLLFWGCGKPTVDHWSEFVPGSTLFVIVPEAGTSLDEMLSSPIIPLFDDISPSAFQLVSNIQAGTDESLLVEAMFLYPDTSNDWQPAWVTQQKPGLIDYLTGNYQPEFEQKNYDFSGVTIEKLFFSDRVLFIVELGSYTVFSESSMAIENIIRAVNNRANAVSLTQDQVTPGSVVFNMPAMDLLTRQFAQVTYRPFLYDIFEGTNAASFQFQQSNGEEWSWQFSGEVELDAEKSSFVRLYSSQPAGFTLDRYIPINAAAFSIFRSSPINIDLEQLAAETDTDNYLNANQTLIRDLRQYLGNEAAFVSFADSGPASTSEYLYLRTLQNSSRVKAVFDELADEGLAIRNDQTYFINSEIIGKLFGSEIYPNTDFYITLYDRVAAIAQRNGLAESVGGDAERRRVMFFDDDYQKVRQSYPSSLSSITYVDAARFGRFIQPWLYPQNYIGTLLGQFDRFVATTQLSEDGQSLRINLTNFEQERTERPFRDQWVFPIGGAEITGKAVLADITGSSRNEVVFSADDGFVYVLATDGTLVLQVDTEMDEPIGSPVVYDWYGNNQNIIMQAAGDKVYAWNREGEILPNFPVQLGEAITTPLTVMDITGNGVSEMILATADRRVHILNARGQAINGWPQSTNSTVRSRPLISEIAGQQSLFVFAENALHAWNINGQRRNGFPVFLSTQISGSPAKFRNHIVASGYDGNLYSIGTSALFSDEFSTTHRSDSLYVQSLAVSNSSLNSTPLAQSVMLRGDDGLFRDEFVLLQSSNGSIFLYDSTGELHFTQSLGQPAAEHFSPFIADINSDSREDIIALADFGRLYAWDILSGERHAELPSTGMRFPVIADFFGDGNKEIITQTRDGLQCWTVYFTRRESP